MIQIPSDLAAGSYYVGILTDPDDRVDEQNEINNGSTASERVVVGVDFVEVLTGALPGAFVGVEYTAFLTARGGDGDYTWSLASGALPEGLSLLASAGEIRGTPTTVGTSTFMLQVDSNGQTDSTSFSIEVTELEGRLTIVTRSLLPGTIGQAYPPGQGDLPVEMQQHVVAVGGDGPITYSLKGAAPAGLMLESDGYLHGTPLQSGVFDLGLEATDGTETTSRSVPLTVIVPGRLTLIAAALPEGVLGEPYSFQLQAFGASPAANVLFELIAGGATLPAGLSLSETGLISGVPERVGVSQFAVQVSEPGNGARETANFQINVVQDEDFGITGMLPVAELGQPYEATLQARGGLPPFVWRVVTLGMLPTGLRFEVNTGDRGEELTFAGTPEMIPSGGQDGNTGGLVSMLISIEDANGRKAERAMGIRVVEPPEPTPMGSGDDGCGCSSAPDADRGAPFGTALAVLSITALAHLRRRKR